jgi:hypothetical protein
MTDRDRESERLCRCCKTPLSVCGHPFICCQRCRHPDEPATAPAIVPGQPVATCPECGFTKRNHPPGECVWGEPIAGPAEGEGATGETVQRWSVGQHMLGRPCEEVEDPDGDWVRYDDHARLLREADAEVQAIASDGGGRGDAGTEGGDHHG